MIIRTRRVVMSTMVTDETDAVATTDLSPNEAREELLRLIAGKDIADHEDIYEALARE
jgi:hypothetical protein